MSISFNIIISNIVILIIITYLFYLLFFCVLFSFIPELLLVTLQIALAREFVFRYAFLVAMVLCE
jgi:hypothetical protein